MFERLDGRLPVGVFLGLFLHDVEHVVVRDDADQPFVFIEHRQREEVEPGDLPGGLAPGRR